MPRSGGSPRNLVCARCASSFLVADNRSVRVDCCTTCHGYIETFDLRETGARDIVPLVDDVATLSLDLWGQARGFQRASLSFAGV